MELPDELWKIVKDYQIDHQKHHSKKLKLCHEQLLLDRPFSLKKRTLGLIRAIGHSPTWNTLSTRDIIIFEAGSESPARLKLHAIEITPKQIGLPNQSYWYDRDIILYYGWCYEKDFTIGNRISHIGFMFDNIPKQGRRYNALIDDIEPDYY